MFSLYNKLLLALTALITFTVNNVIAAVVYYNPQSILVSFPITIEVFADL